MSNTTRRDALIGLGLGTAGLLWPRRRVHAAPGFNLSDLEDLARRFRETPQNEVFDVAAEAIRAGADYKALLGAVFFAGIHEVRPRQVGGKLHSVMMVESAHQLAENASAEEAWLAAFWNLNDFKRSQRIDRLQGDWVLPPTPDVSFPNEEAARAEFVSAMQDWDDDRADRAIVGLCKHHSRESLFELIWPLASRCYVNIGHKIIYAVQIERVLRRIDWKLAEAPLRSLVNAMLFTRADGPRTSSFDHGLNLAAKFPDNWLDGKRDSLESRVILKQLRDAESEQAQQLVVTALEQGLAPESIWDGMRLYASEIFVKRPPSAPRSRSTILPVHPVTVTNAFGYVWRNTTNESTRRLAILQAAGWLPLLKRDLTRIIRLSTEGPGIDQLGAEEEPAKAIDTVFDARSPAQTRAFLDKSPDQIAAYFGRLRGGMFRRAVEHHQYKYAAAVWEESRLVDPRWRARLLAPAIDYLPTAAEPETQVYEQTMHALRKAGVS